MGNDEPTSAGHALDPSSLPEWLVIIPDQPDALGRRLGKRLFHFRDMSPLASSRRVDFGGSMLEHQKEGSDGPYPMKGSVFVFRAESEAEVRKRLEEDVYAKEGVWDMGKLQIIAFRSSWRGAKAFVDR